MVKYVDANNVSISNSESFGNTSKERDDNNVLISNSESKDSNGAYTIEEAIEAIGFGQFQVRVLAMIGFAWMADSLEMALLAILAPAVRCDWKLTHWHEAFLTTIVFVGMFASTYFWGFISDNFGRRKVTLLASFGIFLFGLLSAFSINFWMILVLRGIVGLFMGGIVQGTTLIVEFLPYKARGLTVNFGSLFWAIGASIEIILAMFIMPTYGWRYLLFFSAWPCLLFVIAAMVTKYPPESARFFFAKERSEEAMEILQKAAAINKKTLPDGHLFESKEEEGKHCDHGNLMGAFRKGYWKLTLLLWVIWFISHFNIYGLALFTTSLYSSSYKCYIDEHEVIAQQETDCRVLTKEDYLHFFYVLSADFPAVILVALLADTVGRKWLQAIGFFVMGFFFSLLFICTKSRAWATFFLFGVRCFAAVADIGGYIYTPEVYPTHIRGIALGSCSGISRFGCMLTPFVSQVLTHHSLTLTIAIYLSLSIIGGICCLLLPVETKGKNLEEIHNDLKRLDKSNFNNDYTALDNPDGEHSVKQT